MSWNLEQLKRFVPQDILPELLQAKSIDVLISGPTGVGKSSLVNALLGVKEAEEGDDLKRVTTEVKKHTTSSNDIQVNIWDSPGLQDATGQDEKYIADMMEKCSNYSLVLYCTEISSTRFPVDGDINAVEGLTKAYGDTLWERAIFVLTKANDIPKGTKKNPITFENQLSKLKTAIPEFLIKCRVNPSIAAAVPIVATGYIEEDGDGRILVPTGENWLENLWFTSMSRMKFGSQMALMKFSANRLKDEENITPADLSKPADQQPIGFSWKKVAQYSGISTVAATVLGAIVGFAVAGPIGAGLGGAAGAAAGAAGGATMAIKTK